jgi:glutaminyl-tRNA synthetase
MSDMEKNPLPSHFIRDIIAADVAAGKNGGRVHTRFPPEPNGYLHIGHAKSICLNFGLAEEFGGLCNLRFDDTNPSKEDEEYVESIKDDVRWLGFDWQDRLYWASDYFLQMYDHALTLIRSGKAFVCDLTAEQIREHRGTLTEPGRPSPYRNRTIEENLDLFAGMKNGEYPEGSRVLRAKIDMNSPNLNLRDPVLYRISYAAHHNTGTRWCIYPMYDWAHGLEDSIEGITHSICTLEFEDHRPLYDWFLEQLGVHHPQQIEFARLNVTHMMMSKRKLLALVKEGIVEGWDDPRMPTIAGLRRRGFTPRSLRRFAEQIGVAKNPSTIDYAFLEHCLREDLNKTAQRVMAVLDPLKVVITNYPEDQTEWLEAENNPEDEAAGKRSIPFSREIYIERDDFMENPPKKFFRLSPGREIRLKHAYYITCNEVVREPDGRIVELRCSYDPESRGGWTGDGRKVLGTSHWVNAATAVDFEAFLYDHLFTAPDPAGVEDFHEILNPESIRKMCGCKGEPLLSQLSLGSDVQFLRQGYFHKDGGGETLRFNRSATLKDTWAKLANKT